MAGISSVFLLPKALGRSTSLVRGVRDRAGVYILSAVGAQGGGGAGSNVYDPSASGLVDLSGHPGETPPTHSGQYYSPSWPVVTAQGGGAGGLYDPPFGNSNGRPGGYVYLDRFNTTPSQVNILTGSPGGIAAPKDLYDSAFDNMGINSSSWAMSVDPAGYGGRSWGVIFSPMEISEAFGRGGRGNVAPAREGNAGRQSQYYENLTFRVG